VFVGLADDVNSLYWNPSGLVEIKQTQVMAMHSEWLQNIRYEVLSYAQPLDKNNYLGGYVLYLYLNDLERRSADTSSYEGLFGAYDLVVDVAYAFRLDEKLSIGGGVKLISQNIDNKYALGFAGDTGIKYKITEELTAGACVQNLGPKISFVNEADNLPFNIGIGLGCKLFDKALLLGADINFPVETTANLHFGAEYTCVFGEFSISPKAGFRTDTAKDLGTLAGLTTGLGIGWKSFLLDYAFVPFNDLGNTHQLSLLLKF